MLKNTYTIFLSSILFSAILLFSCKKDNPAVESTKWSVDGYQFTSDNQGGVLIETDTGALFGAGTTSKDAIVILFRNKPIAKSYEVVNIVNKPKVVDYTDDECSIMITNKSGNVAVYLPLLDSAGVVNVSQSGKKITATFDNVRMGYLDATSGDLVEVSASGNIVEK